MEKIYFQADGGGWRKKGISLLGAKFVLDEFHIGKYLRKIVYAREKRQAWLNKGKKKERNGESRKWGKAMKKKEKSWKKVGGI